MAWLLVVRVNETWRERRRAVGWHGVLARVDINPSLNFLPVPSERCLSKWLLRRPDKRAGCPGRRLDLCIKSPIHLHSATLQSLLPPTIYTKSQGLVHGPNLGWIINYRQRRQQFP
jgi:hypothetical protein